MKDAGSGVKRTPTERQLATQSVSMPRESSSLTS
jgi:hypothetical protein